jgi:hypothetical protein
MPESALPAYITNYSAILRIFDRTRLQNPK